MNIAPLAFPNIEAYCHSSDAPSLSFTRSLWQRITCCFRKAARDRDEVAAAITRERGQLQYRINNSEPAFLPVGLVKLVHKFNAVVTADYDEIFLPIRVPKELTKSRWQATQTTYLPDSETGPWLRPFVRDGAFFNFLDEDSYKHFLDGLAVLGKTIGRRVTCCKDKHTDWVQPKSPRPQSERPIVHWIGHATCLVQMGGINIVTDPVFDNMVPFYPRKTPVAIPEKDIPKVDVIVISHNHLDHLSTASVEALRPQQPTVLCPKGMGRWFCEKGFRKVIESDWWSEHIFKSNNGKEVTVTMTPALHWSKRSLLDGHRSLWGGWAFGYGGKKVFFAGDTAYDKKLFEVIREHLGDIDIALLPIGPCGPREHQKGTHVDSAEAVQAFSDLKARWMIPIHWGTFGLGSDALETPLQQLKVISPSTVRVLPIGQDFDLQAADSGIAQGIDASKLEV